MTKDYPLLKLKNVSKFYYNKGMVASGFTKVSLEFNLGEFVAITGESGSGKSTLLNVLSGLDSYEEGEMYINGEETSHYGEEDFEKYRKTYISNIFQSFNLVNSYTVYQNIELVLLLNGYKKRDIKEKVLNLIREVDLYKYRNTKVSHLSGGQKQRVAIARALAKDTPIILADEPTGNLDSKSAKSVLKLLADISKEKLVIIVTHNYEQIENYATRKIEMHDGKVREDISLKDCEEKSAIINEYKDIRKCSLLRLGIRNTFNIFIKFALMFIVFLFVIVAFLGEYGSFKKAEFEEETYGYNYLFRNSSPERIVIKKENGDEITEDEFNKIKAIKNVDKIVENDLLYDTSYNIQDNKDHYFWLSIDELSEITSVDEGRLPENDDEAVLFGNENDWYLTSDLENVLNSTFVLYNDYGYKMSVVNGIKIVGVIYHDYSTEDKLYVSSSFFEKIKMTSTADVSDISLSINGNTQKIEKYSDYMRIIPSKKVANGKAIINYDLNYLCKYSWCKNKNLTINVSNIYYEDSLNLIVSDLYNKNNYDNLIGDGKYSDSNHAIFVSFDDYNNLFNKKTYQSSVFAQKTNYVDDIVNSLKEMGYKTLALKDAKQNDLSGTLAVIKVFKFIVTIILFVALFFIAYFVIKLIQKSKNVYYATVRILGGSSKIVRKLIKIELFTIFHITYILVMLIVVLSYIHIININFITSMIEFLSLKDYIFIYLILFALSYLLASRYSRKLFKTSAMKAYTEEV